MAEATEIKREGKNPIRFLEEKGVTLLKMRTMVLREVKERLREEG